MTNVKKHPVVASDVFLRKLMTEYRSYVLERTVIDDIYTYQQWLEYKAEKNDNLISELMLQQDSMSNEIAKLRPLVNRNIQLLGERDGLMRQVADYEDMLAAKTSIINKLVIASTKGENNES